VQDQRIENVLLDFAEQRELPVLGVCRGMQMIQQRFAIRLCRVDADTVGSRIGRDFAQLSKGALRRLTNRVLHSATGLWRGDREKIDILAQRIPRICSAEMDKISRIYWLIEDCKRFGTRDKMS
jgi:anthranilate/para-aminobenzoate synthase component II